MVDHLPYIPGLLIGKDRNTHKGGSRSGFHGRGLLMADELDFSSSFIPSLHKPSALLPIARHRQSLLYLIETVPVIIVVGQTGSGKTTQIPQFLEHAGWCEGGKLIAVTQVGELEIFSLITLK